MASTPSPPAPPPPSHPQDAGHPLSPMPQVSPVDHAAMAHSPPPWSPAAAAVIGAAFAAAATAAAMNPSQLCTPVATRGGAGDAAGPSDTLPPPPADADADANAANANNQHPHTKPPALRIPSGSDLANAANGTSPHRVVRPQAVLAQSPLGKGSTTPTAADGKRQQGGGQQPPANPFDSMLQSAVAAAAAALASPGAVNAVLQDSPVLLPSSQMEPSPTTGTFPFGGLFSSMTKALPLSGSLQGDASSLERSAMTQWTPTATGASGLPGSLTKEQQRALAKAQCTPPELAAAVSAAAAAAAASLGAECHTPIDTVRNLHLSFANAAAGAAAAALRFSPLGVPSPTSPGAAGALGLGNERPVDDGYNWRKYGQKHVRGSLFPRSYYKCTHPGCTVKKKVERSEIGLVTSCVYKGKHNHKRPSGTPGKVVDMTLGADGGPLGEGTRKSLAFGDPPHSPSAGRNNTESSGPSQFMSVSEDGLEFGGAVTPILAAGVAAAAAAANNGALLASVMRQRSGELVGAPRPGGAADGVLDASPSDAPDAKRRRVEPSHLDGLPPPPPAPPRRLSDVTLEHARSSDANAGKDSRLVVRTRSAVDILEDGYRWRKYGQKLVRGNPNPRSYYKCTFQGCLVRKHVERSSSDSTVVVTTYEGVHSHAAPSQTPAQRGERGQKPRPSPPSADGGGKAGTAGAGGAAAWGIRPLVMPDLDTVARRAGEEPALPTPDGGPRSASQWNEGAAGAPPPPPPPPKANNAKGGGAPPPPPPPPPKKKAAAAAAAAKAPPPLPAAPKPIGKARPAGLVIDSDPNDSGGVAAVTPTSTKEPTPTSARSLDVGGFLTTPKTPSPTELAPQEPAATAALPLVE